MPQLRLWRLFTAY
jgi:mreB: cell shape determining protein, MreB/Mrl family